MTHALPPKWATVPLGSVLSRIEAGASFRCEERPPREQETGVVKVSAVTWGEYDEEESKTVLSSDRIDERFLIRPGDFLFSRANTISLVGACVIARRVNRRVMLSDKILRFHFAGAEPAYVLHFLRSPAGRSEIERLSTGNQESMRNIGQDRIRAIELPLPPLPEQRRIVAALEEHLPDLDAAMAGLKRAKANIGRYREALQEEVLRDCKEVPLADLLDAPLSNGRSVPTSETGFPVLRLTALRRGHVDLAERKIGAWTADDARTVLVAKDDFLIVRGNGSMHLVGRGGLVGAVESPVAYPDTLIRARVDKSRILPAFLRIAWDSLRVRRQIEALARTTAGIYKVNQVGLERVRVPVYEDVQRQNAAVNQLETSITVADRTAADIDIQLARAARLRLSVLQCAFSGSLVPQDTADEPAAELLARLCAPTSLGPSRSARPRTPRARA